MLVHHLGTECAGEALLSIPNVPAELVPSAQGRIKTPYGELSASWCKIGGVCRVTVRVPEGVRLKVKYNGKTVPIEDELYLFARTEPECAFPGSGQTANGLCRAAGAFQEFSNNMVAAADFFDQNGLTKAGNPAIMQKLLKSAAYGPLAQLVRATGS